MFEILGQKQRPLGVSQKRVLTALLTLERKLGEVAFTLADISTQCRAALPRLLPGERKRPLDARPLTVRRLVARGLVDEPGPGCAALTAVGRSYAHRLCRPAPWRPGRVIRLDHTDPLSTETNNTLGPVSQDLGAT